MNLLKHWFWPNAIRREQWVKAKLLSLDSGSKLLDVGAGEQPYRKYCAHLSYFAQDSGEYTPGTEGLHIQGWKYGTLDYRGEAWAIGEKASFFDAILCTEVLEHVPFPSETLQEFARLLKPGGRLILTAPYAALPHMQPQFFFAGFSPEYYRYFLGRLGFEILELGNNGTTYDYLIQELIRSIFAFPWALRWLYALSLVVPILGLKAAAALQPQAQQLVFGYHIEAIKKSRPEATGKKRTASNRRQRRA